MPMCSGRVCDSDAGGGDFARRRRSGGDYLVAGSDGASSDVVPATIGAITVADATAARPATTATATVATSIFSAEVFIAGHVIVTVGIASTFAANL